MSNTASLIYEIGRVQVWGNAIRKIVRVPLPNREREEISVTAPVSEPLPAALTEPPVSQPPEEPRSTVTGRITERCSLAVLLAEHPWVEDRLTERGSSYLARPRTVPGN